MTRTQQHQDADNVILDAFEALCLKYSLNGTIVLLRKEAVHSRRPNYATAFRSILAKEDPADLMAVAHCMRMEMHGAALELWVRALEKERDDD